MNISNNFVDSFAMHTKMRSELYSSLNGEIFRSLCKFTFDLCRSIRIGGKVILFGNGGSAADCDHIVGELRGRYLTERDPIFAISLTDSISTITATSNDYDYESIFSRQLKGITNEFDNLIGLSTSGISNNVIKGMELIKKIYPNINSLFISGLISDINPNFKHHIMIPVEYKKYNVPVIQEITMFLLHFMCEMIDGIVKNNNTKSEVI